MNYRLETRTSPGGGPQRESALKALARLRPLLKGEGRNLAIAFSAITFTSAAQLITPWMTGRTVDMYIARGDYSGIGLNCLILFLFYCAAFYTSYLQTRTMGGVGRRILFNLRSALFAKLQELPVAFFAQNKSGDLISRINNDTDKLNQFFAQALMQFLTNSFLIVGSGALLLSLNPGLGAAALVPAAGVFIITQVISGAVRRANLASLQSLGGLSGEIQESLANFRVVVAFNRMDYFRAKFERANKDNFAASVRAGFASNVFTPLYGLAYSLAQLIVLSLGLYMITRGMLSTGVLIGLLLYVASFYNPLRQLANVWSSFQLALAALDRISDVLALQSDMAQVPAEAGPLTNNILAFDSVSFAYPGGASVLRSVSFRLERGKTYALVGPTGGGKTTTASLMARLYDPASGTVRLGGRDIRSVAPAERAARIGFILQEPLMFTGTVRDNIAYGNPALAGLDDASFAKAIEAAGLGALAERFEDGLQTKVLASGDSISLGQRQLIAFMRAVLRNPDVLILDEATANIDTVTEQLLDTILARLPASTTRVIIAHRLNTIANADEIFFVNGGTVTPAGSMEQAVAMLLKGTMAS